MMTISSLRFVSCASQRVLGEPGRWSCCVGFIHTRSRAFAPLAPGCRHHPLLRDIRCEQSQSEPIRAKTRFFAMHSAWIDAEVNGLP